MANQRFQTLEQADFIRFSEIWRIAKEAEDASAETQQPKNLFYECAFAGICSLLEGNQESEGIAVGAIWGLASTLSIAQHLGELDEQAVQAFRLILDAVGLTEFVFKFDRQKEWVSAVRLAYQYNRTSPTGAYNIPSIRELVVARSLLKLKSQGLQFQLIGTGVEIDSASYARHCATLEGMIVSFGGRQAIDQIFSFFSRSNQIYKGYFLSGRSASTMPRIQEPNIPWHFLYNLALKHITTPSLSRNPEADWEQIIAYAKDLASALNVQPYSIWDSCRFTSSGLNKAVVDNVIFDELFAFPQWGGHNAVVLFNWWIDAMEREGCKFPLAGPETWRLVSNSVLSRSSPREVTFRWGLDRLGLRMTASLKDQFLKALSCPAEELHKYYSTPFDVGKHNSINFPLIRVAEGRFLVMPRSLAARALYECLFSLMRKMSDSDLDNKLGKALEALTHRVLEASGHEPSFKQAEYRSNLSNSRYECDAVVEEPQNIILFECKRKVLTNSARQGNVSKVLVDTSKSFPESFVQLCRHESELIQNSSISFLSGRNLELGRRNVEKIFVSMLDHGSMQSRLFFSALVSVIVSAKFTSDVPDAARDLAVVNKIGAEIALLVESLSESTNEEPGLVLRKLLFSSWWLSVDQLSNLLSPEMPIWDVLKFTRHMAFGTGEVMAEFCQAERMRQRAKAEFRETPPA